jgi:hypothetical protein
LIKRLNSSIRIKILKKNIYELPYYIFDFLFIFLSTTHNLVKYKKIFKKDLVLVTGSDEIFADSLFQLLENVSFQQDIKAIVVYDLGMNQQQVDKLKNNFQDIIYRKFEFFKYPSFFNQRDEYGKLGAYAWKPAIIWDVINEFKCQVVWLDTGNIINSRFKYVRIVLSYIGFFSPISAGRVKDYTFPGTLEELNFPNKYLNKRMLTGGFSCFDWENVESRELLKEWQILSLNKNLILPIGSSPRNHKWDQSLLTVLVYKSGKYPYTPKIKKIFGIKVNQNPGRYFYLVEGLKDSKAEEIREEWYKQNKPISTLTIKDSKIIWITSISNVKKVKIKLLKNNKVICSIFDDEGDGFLKYRKELSFKRRAKFIDTYMTTENNVFENLNKEGKEVFHLESEDLNHIRKKLLNYFRIA